MNPLNITFSVNDYDRDGDIVERGIFLHFGGVRVKAADTLDLFKTLSPLLDAMVREIEENYPDAA